MGEDKSEELVNTFLKSLAPEEPVFERVVEIISQVSYIKYGK